MLDSRFSTIDVAAKELGFEKAFRVGLETEANSINDRIMDSIAHSKMLLFDLSDDERTGEINSNVIYELGLANAIREPSDMVLIKEKSVKKMDECSPKKKLPFDIQGLHMNFFEGELTENFLKKIIADAINNQKWHENKRVRMAAEAIDEQGLGLMVEIGYLPPGFNHFNARDWSAEKKASLHRLIDLGIVRFASEVYIDSPGYEWAYHWTPFGYAVMKNLKIKLLSEEEFKKQKPHNYFVALQRQEMYRKTKEIRKKARNCNKK